MKTAGRRDISRDPAVRRLIRRALREDIGRGDATTRSLVGSRAAASAGIWSRGRYTVSGLEVARAVFHGVDPALRVELCVRDGSRCRPGQRVLRVAGRASSILSAERTALNFLQRMTGIATLTRRFADRIGRRNCAVLDTRKTTPGLRAIEKYAVRCGGGRNHRMGLYDAVLIKDNHRRWWRAGRGATLGDAVRQARRRYPNLMVEVEVESERDIREALEGKPDWVLCDNMSPGRLRRCVRLCRGRVKVEASGGVTLRNAAAIAATGVDAMSVGALTHSAPAADFSLEFESSHRRGNPRED